MECNKDEAVKAKEIAERKFLTRDLPGAKRFALKAQNLYPGLEGIQQMVATFDVYIAEANKILGESNWYGILGLDPQADDEAVRKQYRKLALMLHPDKNKSVGADGAFKCISEAWSFLSDKSKRSLYDLKIRMAQPPPPPPRFTNPAASSSSSKKPVPTGSSNVTKLSAKPPKTPRTKKSSTQASSSSLKQKQKSKQKPNTFWSVCHGCKMQYEYLKIYLNHNLLCPNCREAFVAVEIAPPLSHGSSKCAPTWSRSPLRHNMYNQAANKNASSSRVNNANPSNPGSVSFSGPNSFGQTNFQWLPFFGVGAASFATQAEPAYEKTKNVPKRTAGLQSGGPSKKRKTAEGVGLGNNESNVTNQTAPGVEASFRDLSGTGRFNGVTRPFGNREVPQVALQGILMDRARIEIHSKIAEWKSANAAEMKNKSAEDGKIPLKSQVMEDSSDQNKSAVDGKFPSASSGAKADVETLETLSINVPDPDFHNFDKDRTEKCFGVNQVWAAYDGKDGMPRLYAVIHDVISVSPFKIRISWLNSRTNIELGPINWIGSGFTKTCGEFRVGKYEVYDSLNSFSHKVKWMKGARGVICIYPKKGDVWAVYRNWSPDWNELTAEEVVYKYDMVEVLGDYDEKEGVTVAPLVKVAGFKTVFHQHLDPKEIRSIPTHEMFRFSHIVPSYLLTGQEGATAPKGCRELDPAATPIDLLQVIVDVKDEDMVNNDEESKEEKR